MFHEKVELVDFEQRAKANHKNQQLPDYHTFQPVNDPQSYSFEDIRKCELYIDPAESLDWWEDCSARKEPISTLGAFSGCCASAGIARPADVPRGTPTGTARMAISPAMPALRFIRPF